ncbi:MAG: succinate dehydrogenase, cytochrome b556 subunit, partial [Pelagibacterales bacterium]|nr:succinate dehydrogenase, cytochrome b556 subunit [Pelagibacterales bacterium]
MDKETAPLSPHIQIYKWQLSSLLSITHRMTAIINIIAFCLIILWVVFLSLGPELFIIFQKFLSSFIGKFLLIGFTWSFCYHLLNGIRHLVWDFGYGYEMKTANIS